MMNLSVKKLAGIVALLFMCQLSFAQTKISGTITDGTTKEPLIGVSVQVKGKVIGTITDTKGNYSLNTNTAPPFSLSITSIGYESQEVVITTSTSALNIVMTEQSVLGQEVVVAASRVEEGVMKSPVSVEKMDIRGIRDTPAASFYDGLANLKGVDMATQGLLFKSINLRGFGSTGNPRIVQMIDGMDNSAPGLNFPVDNIVGMPELDVESVELLPGAASALYGPNAVNGLVLMTSKSPFLYQGLSAAIKVGMMSASNRAKENTPFTDYSIRYAKAFNNKFAFKINLAYLQAKDWEGTNYTNLNVGGNADPYRGTGTNSDYDGVNVFGDENPQKSAALGNKYVSRTGLLEKDIVDYTTKSFKFNGALHYRITEKIEAIAQVNYGLGTTVYTGSGRYSLRDFSITQAKLELKGDNFMLRGYTTQENSGKSYQAGLTANAMLQAFNKPASYDDKNGTDPWTYAKSQTAWFTAYATALAVNGGNEIAARTTADAVNPQPGTAAFTTALDNARNTLITNGGGGFDDKTNLYHVEGLYNFKNEIKFVELLVGGNYRRYNLKSNGTLFSDLKDGRTGTIGINEYGAYMQAGKSLLNNHLKLTGSLRYDKNQNFDGQFSPRVSAVTSFGEHNFRVSYQTGFRIPTTQNQYIDLKTPIGTLIGGLDEFNSRYNLATGVTRDVLVDFANWSSIPTQKPTTYTTDPTYLAGYAKYITADVISKATTYATTAVAPLVPAIQAGVTAAVQAQVTAAVTAQVTAAGLTGAAATAAIQAGVAAQMQSAAVQTTIKDNVTARVTSTVKTVATQVTPAYALAGLQKYVPKKFVPEKVQSFEIGYKGLISKRLLVDASYYHSTYKNFIGGVSILVPTKGASTTALAAALGLPSVADLPIESGLSGTFGTNYLGYSRPANSSQNITTSGVSLGLTYSLDKGYNVGGNYTYNTLNKFTPSAEVSYAGFNTPKNVYKVTFGKRIISGSNWGFNVAYRYQDAFLWESSFVVPSNTTVQQFQNTTVPAINNIDAQVSYKLTGMKSTIKLGGTNLFGKPYYQAFGSAYVGSSYYASIVFDGLLN